MSEYLAVKNWDRYQPGRIGKSSPWVKDYTSKDSDPDYSKLTIPQRYVLDGICRLTGREGKRIPNDPLWVGRALCTLPQERHNIGRTIAELVRRGFLIVCNQCDIKTDVPKSREYKEEERERKEPAAALPQDCEILISAIAESHPRNAKPIETERAICQQIERLSRKMDIAAALAYLMERTKTYADHMKKWPPDERRFIPYAHNWYSTASFEAKEELWVYQGKNGSAKSQYVDAEVLRKQREERRAANAEAEPQHN